MGVFIVGAFFTGFLSRAGEDAYEAVKKGTKALCRKASRLDVKLVGSPGKVRETGYSFDFAVGCELLPSLPDALILADISSTVTASGSPERMTAFESDGHGSKRPGLGREAAAIGLAE